MATVRTPSQSHAFFQYPVTYLDKQHINGPALLSLNEQKLEALGVSNSIIKRKIIRWVKEGFP